MAMDTILALTIVEPRLSGRHMSLESEHDRHSMLRTVAFTTAGSCLKTWGQNTTRKGHGWWIHCSYQSPTSLRNRHGRLWHDDHRLKILVRARSAMRPLYQRTRGDWRLQKKSEWRTTCYTSYTLTRLNKSWADWGTQGLGKGHA